MRSGSKTEHGAAEVSRKFVGVNCKSKIDSQNDSDHVFIGVAKFPFPCRPHATSEFAMKQHSRNQRKELYAKRMT